MALNKEQKQDIIKDLQENIDKQKSMVFVDFTGLKAKDILELKKGLKETDSVLKVCKKTLLNLALTAKKIAVNVKDLQGQIAVVFGFKDEIGPAKAIYQFTKENENLKILGGFIENEFQDTEYLTALAQLPSKQELLAKLVGSINSPVSKFANVLQGNIKGLLRVLANAKT
jgi:large subunit ribosomal protein L10